jgi:hypothetical protein
MESNIKDITVIVPIHKLDDVTEKLFDNAVKSIHSQVTEIKPKLLVVIPQDNDFEDKIKTIVFSYAELSLDIDNIEFDIAINTGETDFCNQINYGVSQITTKYFSILEFDDEYSKTYFKNVDEYITAYPDVKGFLMTTILTDPQNNGLQFANENPWSNGFTEQLGFLDMTALGQYYYYMLGGAIIEKDAFEEVGGLKSDIKLYFTLEFLLRFVHNDNKVMSIPKLGYKHMYDREGSLFKEYKNPVTGMTKPEEVEYYLEAAKNEYFFNPKIFNREIKYVDTNVPA